MSSEDEELERVTNEISARLRRVCSEMTDVDFAAMVRSIAENQLRTARHPTWNIPPAP